MPKFISIKREGHEYKVTRDLTPEDKKNTWRRKAKTITEKLTVVQAKVISDRLCIFQYEKAREYTPARYHVIHIPTGLVVADVEYDMVGMVKKTFESSKWTFGKTKDILKLFEGGFQFEMLCKIRYEIVEGIE